MKKNIMNKKKRLLCLQSCSDIITNSSSEVFVMARNDKFVELYEALSERLHSEFDIISTEEDLKSYLKHNLEEWFDWDYLDEILDFNPLKLISSEYTYYKEEFEKIGITSDKIIELVLPAYKGLIGKAILMEEDNYLYGNEELSNFIRIARCEKIVENNFRV